MGTDNVARRNWGNWRQLQLSEEPIYCATNDKPEDILYLEPDNQENEGTRIARRLRCEEQGLRYLNGQRPRLLSTSLRGPFDSTSGWKNPWLPKEKKATHTSLLPQPQPKAIPAIKPVVHKELEKLAARENGTSATRDSMQCHLPSPDRHRNSLLEASSHLDTGKRSRIHEWAKSVPADTLERDDFWAPDEATAESSDASSSSKKRPAGKEWLKSKLQKRRRTDHNPSFAASTPTPAAPAPTSLPRTTSMPMPTIQTDVSDITSRPFVHSLETTTPSSIANNGTVKRLTRQSSRGTSQGDTVMADDNPPRINAALSTSTIRNNAGRTEQPSFTISKSSFANEQPLASSLHRVTYINVSSTPKSERTEIPWPTSEGVFSAAEILVEQGVEGISADEKDDEADNSFETRLDQSFHYRTRLAKQDVPAPQTTRDATNSLQSQPTQTGTPESEDHRDSVAVRADAPLTSARDQQISVEPPVTNDPEPPSNSREFDGVLRTSKLVSPKNPFIQGSCQPQESSQRQQKGQAGAAEPSESTSCRGEKAFSATSGGHSSTMCAETTLVENCEAGEVKTTNECMSKLLPVYTQPSGPHANIVAAPEAESEGLVTGPDVASEGYLPEAMLDEGFTLIGDPMDFHGSAPRVAPPPPERSEAVEYPRQATATAALAGQTISLSCQTKSLSHPMAAATSPLQDRVAATADDTMFVHNSDTGTPAFMIPLAQMEWGVVNYVTSSLTHPTEVLNEELKPPFINTEPVDEDEEEPVDHALDAGMQSPWALDNLHHVDLDVQDIGSEPMEEEWTPCSHPICVSNSPGFVHQPADVQPSQQSPWAQAVLGSLKSTVPESLQLLQVQAAPEPSSLVSQGPEQQQSPWATSGCVAMLRNPDTSALPTNGLKTQPSPLKNCQSASSVEDSNPGIPIGASTPYSLGRHSPQPLHRQPGTPSELRRRGCTPDPDLSIKSFAKFNTPSPKRKAGRSAYSALSGERLPSTQVLADAINTNPRGSTRTRSSYHVSFAPLPGEKDEADGLPPSIAVRASSPPPQSSVHAGDEDVDDHFHKHFDVMKRRRSDIVPKVRLQPRLLPSESQQKPMSPEVGAMAEAFKAADAYQALRSSPETPADHSGEVKNGQTDHNRDGRNENNTAQSPWRVESQSQGVDDVSAVLQNLEDFLNPRWDVETEMDKARAADAKDSRAAERSAETSLLEFSIWNV
ncbi:hypothetical protein BJ170DRAFT_35558 [Xylariales sp. AK1849]|nr:hypothetical protein BJ170DRAFT_35558 [Xylariales sp. AK1849]